MRFVAAVNNDSVLEKNLAALPGMLDVRVNYARSTLQVRQGGSVWSEKVVVVPRA